jgi:hypothetical protein
VIAGIMAGTPQLYHADDATTGNNLVVTLHTTTRRGNDLVVMYDVAGAATSPLDTAATAANSSTLTAAGRGATKNSATQRNAGDALTDAPSIVPSNANGLIFGSMNIGLGPSSGSSAFTYDYIPATWNSDGGDNNGFGNGDGMSHYFNPNTSTVNFGYTMTNASPATWNALAAAFKAGTGDTTPPTAPSNLTATVSPAVLNAYDALNLGTALWDSTQGSGNAAGNAVKFSVPTVANGKVYVGTQTEVDVYGLLPN